MKKLLRGRIIFYFSVIMLNTDPTIAQYFNHLSLMDVGAKATALNGAFSAVSNDYSATFWNPAGLSYIHSVNLGGASARMTLNRQLDFASVIIPFSLKDYFGLSWLKFQVSKIEARSTNSLSPSYLFGNDEQMLWISYSRKISRIMSLGINAKIMQSRLDQIQSNGHGIDVGLLLNPFKSIYLSLVSQDLFSAQSWSTGQAEHFNRIDRVGCAVTLFDNLLISSDIHQRGKNTYWSVGTELQVKGLLKMRTGFQNNLWAFGTGISLPIMDKSFLIVNYAYRNDVITLEPDHVFDFNLRIF
jgi:hypothetical protein